jgi:hypothetical protein
MNLFKSQNKIIDSNPKPGSRADQTNFDFYQKDFIDTFKPLRKPNVLISSVFKGVDLSTFKTLILNRYKIAGVEYGNWVNQFRRIDFDLNFLMALHDFNKVLKFEDNIGINKTLYVGYGSRGMARAYAHYEPATHIINLTRDRRADKIIERDQIYIENAEQYKQVKEWARKENSGYGSFAHEYGHFLDYVLAEKYCKNRHRALSGGAEPIFSYSNIDKAYEHFNKVILYGSNPIEVYVKDILKDILFKVTPAGKVTPTSYYKRLYDYAENRGDYWLRLNEIWARFFEIYTAYKLHILGINNIFLVRDKKGKYFDDPGVRPHDIYLSYNEMDKIYKKADKFLVASNKLINNK